MVTVQQVHGAVIRDLEEEPKPWMTEDGRARLQGDGLMSLHPGRLLAILTADCVPVLVADTRTRAVAAFHAGWRGTLARIVQHGVGGLRERYGSEPEDLIAAIGPCIGPCCFEIGEEVRSGFQAEFQYASELFAGGKDSAVRMNLVEANRRQLQEAGVPAASVSVTGECTACARLPDGRRRFYSHRAERGFAGRMLNVIGTIADGAGDAA
jgi:YfiH family protein